MAGFAGLEITGRTWAWGLISWHFEHVIPLSFCWIQIEDMVLKREGKDWSLVASFGTWMVGRGVFSFLFFTGHFFDDTHSSHYELHSAVLFCDLYSIGRGRIFYISLVFGSIEIPQHQHSFIIQILIQVGSYVMADLFLGDESNIYLVKLAE